MVAEDDTCQEQADGHYAEEVNDTAKCYQAALKGFEMRHNAQSGYGINEPGCAWCEILNGACDGWKPAKYEKQASHDREDEADDLVARGSRGGASHSEVGPCQKQAS